MADQDFVELPEDFDRLLRQELSVEPSPAFAFRVRARAAEQQRRPWWQARWIPAVGSVATVASLALAVTVPAITRWTSAPVPPVPPATSYSSMRHPSLASAFSAPAKSPSPVQAPRASGRRAIDPEVPLVIVDGRDRVALERFVNMVQQGRVTDDAFAHRSTAESPAIKDTMLRIVVAPVAVNSIPPGGVLSSETERK